MAKVEHTVVGTSPARMGGVERVIGAGIYGIDLALKDELHGGILRSQYAHAKIMSIDTSEAKKVPGVHAVVTAADAPDVRYGRTYIDRYMLAKNKVRYMGDPVAAVAAESPALVKQVLKKIKVVYEPLPVVLDPEETMKPEAPILHEDMPLPKNLPADVKVKNVCSYTPGHAGDPDKAMAEADVIVVDKAEETISTTIRSGAKMYIKTGVKKDGTIVARTGKVIYDAGAYSGFGAMAGARCTNMLGGWYLMPNVHIDGYVVYTNKQVCGPVRGPGGPQAAFAVESHMDSI